MDWTIIDSLANPDTGTYFALAQTSSNLKLILWCQGDYFLRENNVLSTGAAGLYVDGRLRNVAVMHAAPFNPQLWQAMVRNTQCPGNDKSCTTCCPEERTCLFTLCPYGMRKYIPVAIQAEQLNVRQVS